MSLAFPNCNECGGIIVDIESEFRNTRIVRQSQAEATETALRKLAEANNNNEDLAAEKAKYAAMQDTKPAPNPVSPSVLDQAKAVIYGEREQTYGAPDKNLRTIAAYWTNHMLAAKGINASLTPDDVSVMMILLKAARLANSPKHEDSLVDICGYAALADRCNKESTPK